MRDNKFADEMQAQHNASLANLDFSRLGAVAKSRAEDGALRQMGIEPDSARAERYAAALRAIIARADTDKPGTSKVQDMRRLAAEALGE